VLLLRHNRGFCNAGQAEDTLVALDFCTRAQRFLEIVGKFHGRPAIGIIELADQA
jgi:hypothetical protein